jgi:Mn-dependent DtxR family transcriptional regulator
MEYRTMNRKELAGELGVSPKVLRGLMKKYLTREFLEFIKERPILFKNEVQHIHKRIGATRKW